MDPKPGESFTLSSNNYLYGLWDHQISPRAYFERYHNKTVHSMDDNRPYSSKLIEYLEKNGAQLVESRANIEDKKGMDDDGDMMTTFLGDVGSGSYHLYWYKDNLVSVTGDNDGTCLIDVTCAINEASVHDEFKPFLAPRKEGGVGVLLSGQFGMTIKQVDFDPPVIDDLDLNYGKGFREKVYAPVLKKLGEHQSGLILFHGPPGVGKSIFIKYLTSVVKRPFVFIPVSMAGDLSSPAFLKLLMGYADSILVLEDAEQALQSREKDFWNSSVVSTLLNLSDGILGTILNVSIVATYNCDKQTIDKALLRKGRLRFDYNFDKLSTEDANKLARHLKKPANFTEPTSIADVYNLEDDTNYTAPVQKSMGFGFSPKK